MQKFPSIFQISSSFPPAMQTLPSCPLISSRHSEFCFHSSAFPPHFLPTYTNVIHFLSFPPDMHKFPPISSHFLNISSRLAEIFFDFLLALDRFCLALDRLSPALDRFYLALDRFSLTCSHFLRLVKISSHFLLFPPDFLFALDRFSMTCKQILPFPI